MALAVVNSPERWTERWGPERRTVLSVGNFDGLHLGHQKILRMVVERARATAQLPAVLTFDPHPMRVLRPEQAPRMIQTLAQRLAGFEQIGVEAALVLHFDRAFSLVSPEQFIEDILVSRLHVAAIFVGANFHFGHRGAGNIQLLAEFGRHHRFDVEIVSPVELNGQVVSSTAVRNAVADGDVEGAIPLLGRPFALTGEIRPGAGRGRTISIPTLNLAPEQELLPKQGVYATQSVVRGAIHRSVTNIGTRPTFDGKGITVESHLLEFNEQITGGPMEVRFHKRLREERKFSGVDELRAQIARDIDAAQEYFSSSGIPQNSVV